MRSILPKAIVIQLSPSYLLLGLLAIVATVSAMIILMLSISLTTKYVVFFLIIASTLYFILRDAMLLLPGSWQAIQVDVKGVLTLTNNKQQQFKPQLLASSFTHQYLTILNFKRERFWWALPPVLLLPNFSGVSANQLEAKDALRRLRVWMRLFKHDRNHRDDFTAVDG